MIKTLSVYDFIQEFENSYRSHHFSNEGLQALYEWLEDLYYTDEDNYELDVIGLCCDFTEYENLEEFNKDYGQNFEDLEEVRDYTVVIELSNGAFIIQAF